MSTGTATSEELARPSAAEGRGRARRLWGKILLHPVAVVVLVALVVRVAAALVIRVKFGGAIFLDDLTYPQLAEGRVNGSSDTWDSYTRFLYGATATLTVPLTLLYRVFGPEILVGQLFVAIFGAAAAGLSARLVALRLGPGYALFAGLCVALLPSQVLWSSLTLKDPLVWTCLAGLAVTVAMANRTGTGRRLTWLLVAAAALLSGLVWLRPHTLVVACFALLIAACFGRRRSAVARLTGIGLLVVVIPWGLAGIGPLGLSLALSPGSLEERRANNAANASTAFVPDATGETPEEIAERVEAEARAATLRAEAARAEQQAARAAAAADEARRRLADLGPGTAVPEDERRGLAAAAERAAREAAAAEAQAVLAMQQLQQAEAVTTNAAPPPRQDFGGGNVTSSNLRQLPTGIAVMMIAPYLWETPDNARVTLARYEMVLWYPLLLLAAVGLLGLRRHSSTLVFPLLATGAVVLMYALTEGNFGTAYRHRGEFVWSVCVFAAFGLATLVPRLRRGSPLGQAPSDVLSPPDRQVSGDKPAQPTRGAVREALPRALPR